jgi:hypothetical protein
MSLFKIEMKIVLIANKESQIIEGYGKPPKNEKK